MTPPMIRPQRFDPAVHTVGLKRDLSAVRVAAQPGPAMPIDGVTVGVATMTENAPHDGEMHPDGDEVLYLISGLARVTVETDPVQVLELRSGDGLIVPKGVWHKVDIIEPCRIVYVTPGPGGEYRPLTE